jgi:hypothetical protein
MSQSSSSSSSSFVLGPFSGGYEQNSHSLAFSLHPSSILADRLDPQPMTKDNDEDDWDMTLNRFVPGYYRAVPAG